MTGDIIGIALAVGFAVYLYCVVRFLWSWHRELQEQARRIERLRERANCVNRGFSPPPPECTCFTYPYGRDVEERCPQHGTMSS